MRAPGAHPCALTRAGRHADPPHVDAPKAKVDATSRGGGGSTGWHARRYTERGTGGW